MGGHRLGEGDDYCTPHSTETEAPEDRNRREDASYGRVAQIVHFSSYYSRSGSNSHQAKGYV